MGARRGGPRGATCGRRRSLLRRRCRSSWTGSGACASEEELAHAFAHGLVLAWVGGRVAWVNCDSAVRFLVAVSVIWLVGWGMQVAAAHVTAGHTHAVELVLAWVLAWDLARVPDLEQAQRRRVGFFAAERNSLRHAVEALCRRGGHQACTRANVGERGGVRWTGAGVGAGSGAGAGVGGWALMQGAAQQAWGRPGACKGRCTGWCVRLCGKDTCTRTCTLGSWLLCWSRGALVCWVCVWRAAAHARVLHLLCARQAPPCLMCPTGPCVLTQRARACCACRSRMGPVQ